MHVQKEPTIKCWCGYDTKISRVNLLIIYYDVVCPRCGRVIIKGRNNKPDKYTPWPHPYDSENYMEGWYRNYHNCEDNHVCKNY